MFRRFIRPPFLFAILPPFILFSPLLLTGKAMFWGTPATQFVPWWSFAWERIRFGELPLWNPYLGMGAPLVANYQSAIFYPPNWIYFILDTIGGTTWMAWGQALLVALHLAWAGIGAILLAKKLGIGELGQSIAGLSYGLCGYLVSRAGFLSINSATAWLPWIILAVTVVTDHLRDRYRIFSFSSQRVDVGNFILRNKWLVSVLWLSLIIGLLLLAGHAQIAWYAMLFTTGWTIFLSLDNTRSVPLINALTVLLLVVLLGSALAAVQLIPTGEYLLESQRSGSVDYTSAMSYSFWPWQFLTFLAPDLFGSPVDGDFWGYANYWEGAVYIGLVPFFLALIAISARVRKSSEIRGLWHHLISFLVIVIIISFVLALGWYTPVFPWLFRHIPTFDMFQGPARFSILAVFSLALLAGIGTEFWRKPAGKALYWTRLGTMGALAVALTASVAPIVTGLSGDSIEPSLFRSIAMAGVWGVGFGILTLAAPENGEREISHANWNRWQWAVCVWVTADLLVAWWGIIPGIDREFYADDPEITDPVKSMVDDGRLYLPESVEVQLKFERFFRFETFEVEEVGSDWQALRASLLPNISLLDRIPSANNFDPLLPGRYAIWMSELSNLDEGSRKELLSLMSVQVIERITDDPEKNIEFLEVDSLPRISWVPCARFVDDAEAALELVLNGALDYSREVVLEGLSESSNDCLTNESNPTITMLADEPGRISLSILSASPGYLVISDVWYPGWRSFLDNQPIDLYRANYLFRGISIPTGEHELVITYQNEWFKLGMIVSMISWLLLGILAVIHLKKH
jgi:hypothetical protein